MRDYGRATAPDAIDWNEQWKQLQRMREHADSPEVWNEKAASFPVKHGSQDGYVGRFLELANVLPGESVLDMGCGTGSVATPLALAGHPVVGADFSEGMLQAMIRDQRSLGIAVEAKLLSWQDDWDEAGIGEGFVDVALASRSIATYDLKESLMKLTRAARRRVCITLPAGPSPRCDASLLAAAGLDAFVGSDFLYAFNILASLGILPEVDYISSPRIERFDSLDSAVVKLDDIVRNAVAGRVEESSLADIAPRLRRWLDDNLVEDEATRELTFTHTVKWAFLAWNRD